MDLRRHAADAAMARVLGDYLLFFEHKPKEAGDLCRHALANMGNKVGGVQGEHCMGGVLWVEYIM